ncbi:MAG: alpha/beta hydrolase [Acidobacteriota bacterium]|nr:alpha/beta hydrolase [Acidobacteriota bacterium]
MRALSALAPGAASRVALRLFRTPPRHTASELESRFLGGARAATLSVAETPAPIPVWIWGEGPPVLLVHGWGSRGARLGSFVAPLVAAGYSVIAFDAPGHGRARERQSSLPQFLFAIEAAAREHGPFAGIVAHSMGGAATTLSMARGVRAERVVFLAPAADPAGYVRYFAALLGLPDNVRRGMERRIVERFGMNWPEFDVPVAAKALTSPLLVIHDALDADVPLSNGEAIAKAWPGAVLVTTNGLGHKRIVHDEEVVARAVEFLLASEKSVAIR